MKYPYLILIGVVSVAAISLVAFNKSDEVLSGRGAERSEPGMEESGDLGSALKMLVSNKSIPRIPLKDLFADPAENSLKQQRTELSTARITTPVDVGSNRKTSTTPRLIGVVLRESETRAFFVDNDKTYSLKRGDTLAGRYRIVSITSDKVNIREISTGLSRSIFIKDER